jgi:spermidine synthase
MPMRHALLFSVFVIASCGLAYELIAGALASYLLGDSVMQFSTVIGTYLFAMGVGSWLSKYITRDLVGRFIQIELMVGLLGGFSAVGLFFVFTWLGGPFKLVLYLLVFGVGVLVGLEIPLVMRILKRELASRIWCRKCSPSTISVRWPCPSSFRWCSRRTSAWCAPGCSSAAQRRRGALGAAPVSRATAGARWRCPSWAVFGRAARRFRRGRATDHAGRSPPLRRRNRPRRNDTLPAHRRHPLARRSAPLPQQQPAVFLARRVPLPRGAGPSRAGQPAPGRRVLVLGGGDGLAVREILKYPNVESVTLVDLDPAMTELCSPRRRRWSRSTLAR